MVSDESVDLRPSYFDDPGLAEAGGLLHGTVGMPDRVDHGLDPVMAQRQRLLGCRQLIGKGEYVFVPTLRFHDHLHRGTLTGAGIADVDPFTLETC